MSYILDALRKSDQQRQSGMAPTLSGASIPVLTPERSRLSGAHVLYGMAALVLLGLGVGIGWLRPWQGGSAVPERPAAEAVAAPSVPPATSAAASLPAVARLPVAAVPVEETRVVEPPVEKKTPVLPGPTRGTRMPSAPAAEAMPNIVITVHAYAPDPRERLAGINGRLLREGQEVAPGLKLEGITEEGVILNFRGRRFRRAVR